MVLVPAALPADRGRAAGPAGVAPLLPYTHPARVGSAATPHPAPGHRRLGAAASALAAAAALAVVAAVPPTSNPFIPPCPLKLATGLDCPLCGTTRALHELLTGDVVAALDHNVLAVAAIPFVIWAWLAWAAPGRVSRLPFPRWAGPALAVLVATFTVARNVASGPLALLEA